MLALIRKDSSGGEVEVNLHIGEDLCIAYVKVRDIGWVHEIYADGDELARLREMNLLPVNDLRCVEVSGTTVLSILDALRFQLKNVLTPKI